MRNLPELVKKALCYQKLFWPVTVWINCSSDLKNFANSLPSTSNFKSFSRSQQQLFLTVGQNNIGNKIQNFCPCGKNCFIKYLRKSSLSHLNNSNCLGKIFNNNFTNIWETDKNLKSFHSYSRLTIQWDFQPSQILSKFFVRIINYFLI